LSVNQIWPAGGFRQKPTGRPVAKIMVNVNHAPNILDPSPILPPRSSQFLTLFFVQLLREPRVELHEQSLEVHEQALPQRFEEKGGY
jgi:hypothetical protein